MKLRRRTFLHLSACAALLPAMPRAASALDYPTRPVRIIVGFPPGGGVDTAARPEQALQFARVIADRLHIIGGDLQQPASALTMAT